MSGAGTTKSTVVVGKWKGSGMTEPGPLATDTRLLEQPNRLNRKDAPVANIVPPRPPNGQVPRRNLRERWRAEVMRTALIGDAAKLLLLAMHDNMDAKGYVSLLRPVLAARIGRSERRVTERLSEAVAAGFLDRVARGQKGVTPVYRASLPDPVSGTVCSPLNVQRDGSQPAEQSPDRPADTPFSGTPGGPTSSKAHPGTRTSAQQEPGGSSSSFIEEVELEANPAETAAINETLRKACAAWGMPVPAELAEGAA